jgi:hypothetical protein
VFPEREEETPVSESEETILRNHFHGDSERWLRRCFFPALHQFKDLSNGTGPKLARRICGLYDWYKPKRATNNEMIPSGFGLVEKYVRWIEDQQWIDHIDVQLFRPESKVFQRFFNEIQNLKGVDFLTGRDR